MLSLTTPTRRPLPRPRSFLCPSASACPCSCASLRLPTLRRRLRASCAATLTRIPFAGAGLKRTRASRPYLHHCLREHNCVTCPHLARMSGYVGSDYLLIHSVSSGRCCFGPKTCSQFDASELSGHDHFDEARLTQKLSKATCRPVNCRGTGLTRPDPLPLSIRVQ